MLTALNSPQENKTSLPFKMVLTADGAPYDRKSSSIPVFSQQLYFRTCTEHLISNLIVIVNTFQVERTTYFGIDLNNEVENSEQGKV